MFRVAAVAVFAAVGPFALVTRLATWAADVAPSDPTALLPSLGIGGAVAGILFLWLRAEQKRAEKLEGIVEAFVPTIQRLTVAVDAATKATEESTAAMEKMTEMVTYRWPQRRAPG